MSTAISQLIARNDKTAPPYEDSDFNLPTLLTSWWATFFAATIIIIRVCGRYIRSEMLFREDKIMFFSLVPLFARMAFVHVVLLYQTNNVQLGGLTPEDIDRRSIGSRMVLASRIFYAMFIWTAKLTVSEFLKRITATSWNRTQQWILQGIRGFLVFTFIGAILGTLVECQPFNHYWQVVPDPGAWCRQGYAQLMVMGVSDVVTDILLIIFPIPIIIRSHMTVARKLQLCLLFSLSAVSIVVTVYRIPAIIDSHFRQQLRSLWASYEILAAAFVTNTVILGSFVRDRGVRKYRYRTGTGTVQRPDSGQPSINRTMTKAHWGSDSDENLFRSLGGRLNSVSSIDAEELANLPGVNASVINPTERIPRKVSVTTTQIDPNSRSSSEDEAGSSLVADLGHKINNSYLGSYYQDLAAPTGKCSGGVSGKREEEKKEEEEGGKAISSRWVVYDHNIQFDPYRSDDAHGPEDLELFDMGGILEKGGPKSTIPVADDIMEVRTRTNDLNAFSFGRVSPPAVLAQDFAVPRSSAKTYSTEGHPEVPQAAPSNKKTQLPLAMTLARMKLANGYQSLTNVSNPLSAKQSESSLSTLSKDPSDPDSSMSGKSPKKTRYKQPAEGHLYDAGGLLST